MCVIILFSGGLNVKCAQLYAVPRVMPTLSVTVYYSVQRFLSLVTEFVCSSLFPLFNTAHETRTSRISFLSNAAIALLVEGKRVCD